MDLLLRKVGEGFTRRLFGQVYCVPAQPLESSSIAATPLNFKQQQVSTLCHVRYSVQARLDSTMMGSLWQTAWPATSCKSLYMPTPWPISCVHCRTSDNSLPICAPRGRSIKDSQCMDNPNLICRYQLVLPLVLLSLKQVVGFRKTPQQCALHATDVATMYRDSPGFAGSTTTRHCLPACLPTSSMPYNFTSQCGMVMQYRLTGRDSRRQLQTCRPVKSCSITSGGVWMEMSCYVQYYASVVTVQ